MNGTMLLIIAASGLYIYDAALFKSLIKSASSINRTVPGTYMGNNLRGVDWADAEDVKTKVEADVLKNLRSTNRAAVKAFVKEPQNRLLLAQWMLAQSEVGSAELLKQTEDNVAKQIEKLKEKVPFTQEEEKQIEYGADVEVWLEIKDISDSVSSEDKAKVEEKLGDADVAMYANKALLKSNRNA